MGSAMSSRAESGTRKKRAATRPPIEHAVARSITNHRGSRNTVHRGRPPTSFSAVSLFSGCGGLDLGAEQTGRVKTVWAVDNDSAAVETYRRNLGAHIWRADVAEIEFPVVRADLLLAGPPCQDFSSLWNHDGAKTPRGNLFREVARFLDQRQPVAFIVENVAGLMSANHGEAWLLVRHALRSPSRFLYDAPGPRYEVRAELIDFATLGVPQHRPRLVVIGIRSDVGIRPSAIPQPFAGAFRTVADVLDAGPICDDAPNHEIGLDSEAVVERLKLIGPGENYRVIPSDHPLAVKGLISHVYRRLDPNRPAYTVIASGGGGTHGYHHCEPRRLSNRERARLQTFPDSFVFYDGAGGSNYPQVRRQIGNALPPEAGRIIVGALVEALRGAGVRGTPARDIQHSRRLVARMTPTDQCDQA